MRATSTPDRDVMNSILRNVLEKEERFNGVWTLWEPNALDGKDAEYAGKPGYDETGRFCLFGTEIRVPYSKSR